MRKILTIGSLAVASVAIAAITAAVPKQDEMPLPKRMAISQQSAATADDDTKEYGYTLYGKSMFDSEGNNVYRLGGEPVKYGVDVNLNAEASEALLLNIVNMEHRGTAVAGKGVYDAQGGTISILSPTSPVSGDDFTTIGTVEEMPVKLLALNAYGIGYVENLGEFVVDVLDEGRKLVPRSGFAGYVYDAEYNGFVGSIDVVYDAVLFKNEKGVHMQTKENGLDFGNAYKGVKIKREFRLYNTGSEASDFIVYTDNEAFITNISSGFIKPGEWKDITVTYSPSELGDISSILAVESESDDILELPLKASCLENIDYSAIVNGGDISFQMASEYPWKMSEIDGAPVAISDNVGIYESQSVLRATCTIGENEIGTFNWDGYYDSRFYCYDPFTVAVDGEEVFHSEENGPVVGEIKLGPGEHVIDFIYEKEQKVDAFQFEYGNDYTYIKSLSLTKESVQQFDFVTDVDAVDFGRYFKGSFVGDNLDFTRTVHVANRGWDAVEFKSFETEYPFSASAEYTTVASQETGSFEITVNTNEPGDYYGVVTVKTNDKDIRVVCHVLVQEMPDYSAIVKEGEFKFDTYRLSPYVVDGDKAYNSSGGNLKDNNEPCSFLMVTFNVPEGKTGNICWKGEFDPDGTNDIGLTMLDQNLMSLFEKKKCYAGEKSYYPYQVRQIAPGEHSVIFIFFSSDDNHNVTGTLSVSDLSLTFDPIPKRHAEIWGESIVDFGEISADAGAEATTNIANTGSEMITVTDVKPSLDGVFNATLLTAGNELESLNMVGVNVTCNPNGKTGLIEGTVTVNTSVGAVEIPCRVVVEAKEDAFYSEGFERGVDGWTFFDDDESPAEQWELVANATNAHGGSGMIRSNSWTNDWSLPFNYAVSPEIEIPDWGATLRYWVMAESPSEMEHYKVFVGNGTDIATYTEIDENEVNAAGWNEHKVSLDEFAGQKKSIIFLHCADDCCGWLYIDDISISSKTSSVQDVTVEIPVSTEYYTIDGRRAPSEPVPGIYVKLEKMADGSRKVSKILIK